MDTFFLSNISKNIIKEIAKVKANHEPLLKVLNKTIVDIKIIVIKIKLLDLNILLSLKVNK